MKGEDLLPAAFARFILRRFIQLDERLGDVAKSTRARGVFDSEAVKVGPIALPAPAAATALEISLDVSSRVIGRQDGIAEDAARRDAGEKMTAALARMKKRLPCGIDDLIGR